MAAARGIIISLSLLFAAGLAVYENPQVREWIDQHRQKIAVTLQGWGDDLGPPTPTGRRTSRSVDDASTKEDNSPEAVERRRQLVEELAERRRILSEKSGRSTPRLRRGSSFDDMVDSDGHLRANTTGLSKAAGDSALRRRVVGAAGAAAGAAFANPFSDEMSLEHADERCISDEEMARQLQATFDREAQEAMDGPISPQNDPLTDEELAQFRKHVTLFDGHDQAPDQVKSSPSESQALSQYELDEFQQLLEAETGRSGVEEVRRGTHGISEQELLQHLRELEGPLVEIDESGRRTPTATTTAPSTHTYPHTPGTGSEVLVNAADATSTHPSEPALVNLTPTTSTPGTPRQLPRQPTHQPSYQSIQDWAEQSTASFHSLPDEPEQVIVSRPVSALSSIHAPSEMGSEDLVSEPGISTPGTWTEVGSVVSADEHNPHQH